MIEVENVSKLFGNFRAVDGISFSIQTGEIVGLLGPNGAGKTTTMRMISGFLEPDSGTVKIDGLDVLKNPVETKRKIGYMPESAPMYSDMIVADYFSFFQNAITFRACLCYWFRANFSRLMETIREKFLHVFKANMILSSCVFLILCHDFLVILCNFKMK